MEKLEPTQRSHYLAWRTLRTTGQWATFPEFWIQVVVDDSGVFVEFAIPNVLRDLAINVVAIVVLAYGLYFRRHRRRDLFLGYIAFNISIFSISAAVGSAPLTIGVGFGLFAVLSIVRLRSDETTQAEIGYTMVSLVLGLLMGLPGLAVADKILFATVLVTAMYLADHPWLLPYDRHQQFRVELETIHSDPQALRADLEQRLGGEVKHMIVQSVDFVRETTRVDVRVRIARRPHPRAKSDA
ncbi:MAG: DUF4956 domain-containing protein [Nitriliruptoraceae bacterium]